MIQRWPGDPPILSAIARGQLIKLIVYLFVSVLSVSAIYLLSDSARTVPCILLLFYLMLLVANQLDFWDFIFYEPLRFVVLLLAGFVLVGLRIGFGRQAFIVVFASLAAVLWVSYRLMKRWKRTLLTSCVVSAVLAILNIVGCSTHQARVWKVDQEDQLERVSWDQWPHSSPSPVVVMTASGGGSRAAVYTGLTLTHLNQYYPEVAEQLQVISSVSGGSLANAAYTVRMSRGESLDDLVDALSSDFLFPTLIGAAVPGQSRGEAIEREWQEGKIGLGEYSLQHLAKGWKESVIQGSDKPPFPLPLFNTATLEGHDLVISPLESTLFTSRHLHEEARNQETNRYTANTVDGDPTWVYYRHCVYGLEHLLPEQNALLSEAVLASANFPFGFPVVKVEPAEDLPEPLYFSPKPNPRPWPVKLTDGGALSNSGMWSLFNLLVNKKDELVERGVLLIIVEASKMPEHADMKSTFNRLLGTIGDQAPIGRNLHEVMLSYLEKLYGDRLATVQLDLTPSRSNNIMTTWALDKQSQKQLETIFDQRWQDEADSIGVKWCFLKQVVGCRENVIQVLERDFVAKLLEELTGIGVSWSPGDGDQPKEELQQELMARLQERAAKIAERWCILTREEDRGEGDKQPMEELQQELMAGMEEKVAQCLQQQEDFAACWQEAIACLGAETCMERWSQECRKLELIDRRRLPLD
jgi:hypothetical protein